MVWNCQGVGKTNFHKIVSEYAQEFEPAVFVLLETRVSGGNADWVIKRIGWKYSHRVEAYGFSGGIWILWNDKVNVRILGSDFQFVHMEFKFPDLDDWILFIGVYGSPKREVRKDLWKNLGDLARTVNCPWLLAGDFNAMLCEEEKKGGLSIGRLLARIFSNF